MGIQDRNKEIEGLMADGSPLMKSGTVGSHAIGALECLSGSNYDEETFLYLLAVERARAARSNRPLRLVFATLEPVPGTPVPIPRATAERLFRGMRQSLRETDVTGWYRQHRVAGALLTERREGSAVEVSARIERRIDGELRQKLPARIARTLRVRIVSATEERSGN